MLRKTLATSAVAVLVSACSVSSEPVREWTPEDHVQPPESQIDPSRVPQRQVTNPAEQTALLWQGLCASCHGSTGRGNGWELQAGVDFTSAKWQKSRTDSQITNQIKVGAAPMPSFANRLTDAEIAALVKHIRGLAPASSPK